MRQDDRERRRPGGLYELRRKRREERLRNYAAGEDGEYRYRGSYMVCDSVDYRAILGKMLAAALALLVFCLFAGCVTQTGMEGNAVLLLPYAGSLVAVLLEIASIFRMRREGERLREHVYKGAAERLPASAFIGTVLSAVGLTGLVFQTAAGTYTGSGIGAAACVLVFVTGVCGHLYLFLIRKKLRWHEEK